jgi:hypothetical protein
LADHPSLAILLNLHLTKRTPQIKLHVLADVFHYHLCHEIADDSLGHLANIHSGLQNLSLEIAIVLVLLKVDLEVNNFLDNINVVGEGDIDESFVGFEFDDVVAEVSVGLVDVCLNGVE